MAGLVITSALIMGMASTPACGSGYDIDPVRIAAVAKHESTNHPLAINVNGPGGREIYPETLQEAVTTAKVLQAEGRNFDLGLMQINSTNLQHHNLTFEQAFEACSSIAAGAQHMFEDGDRVASKYNTGNSTKGIENGYADGVDKDYKEIKNSKRIAPTGQNEPVSVGVTCPGANSMRVQPRECVSAQVAWHVLPRSQKKEPIQ